MGIKIVLIFLLFIFIVLSRRDNEGNIGGKNYKGGKRNKGTSNKIDEPKGESNIHVFCKTESPPSTADFPFPVDAASSALPCRPKRRKMNFEGTLV